MTPTELPAPSRNIYIFLGCIIPLLPAFLCFWILAAAAFSSDPWGPIVVFTAIVAIAGGCIGAIAHRGRKGITSVMISALLAPAAGYVTSGVLVVLLERIMTASGLIQQRKMSDFAIRVVSDEVRFALLAFFGAALLITSIGYGYLLLRFAKRQMV